MEDTTVRGSAALTTETKFKLMLDISEKISGTLDLDTRDCTVTYHRGGKKLAAAFVHRDLDGRRAEAALEGAAS